MLQRNEKTLWPAGHLSICMSLKSIKLPFNVLANLYTAPLIQEKAEPAQPVKDNTGLKFLGGNQKHISILVNTSEAPFITDKALHFLTGILNACKFNMADVAIINLYQPGDKNYLSINTLTAPSVLLLFGVEPNAISMPLQFPPFQPQKYNNVVYLAAPELEIIEQDKAIKGKLWACLKTIFQL